MHAHANPKDRTVRQLRREAGVRFGPGAWIAIAPKDVLLEAFARGAAPTLAFVFDGDTPTHPGDIERALARLARRIGSLEIALAEVRVDLNGLRVAHDALPPQPAGRPAAP